MKTAQLTTERLEELTRIFSAVRVAVLGDFFLDKYLEVDPELEETSLETGKPAHQVCDQRSSPGAAGTVISNLAALRAGGLHAIGYTGDDGEGFDLRRALTAIGCNTEHLHVVDDRLTPTYLKPRDRGRATLAAEHCRYDTKNRTPTDAATEAKILTSLDAILPTVDAVIIMDQVEEIDCGAVTARIRGALAKRAQRRGDTVFWVDSRRRIREFRHAIIKANEFEVVGNESPSPEDVVEPGELERAARTLRERNEAPVVVTRGERGSIVSDPEWTAVPGVAVGGELDPTGAGDSATAGAVIALCSGASLPEAALIGNLVASITVQQIGRTGTARPEQLQERLVWWQEQRGS